MLININKLKSAISGLETIRDVICIPHPFNQLHIIGRINRILIHHKISIKDWNKVNIKKKEPIHVIPELTVSNNHNKWKIGYNELEIPRVADRSLICLDKLLFIFYHEHIFDIYCYDIDNDKIYKSQYKVPKEIVRWQRNRVNVLKHKNYFVHLFNFQSGALLDRL